MTVGEVAVEGGSAGSAPPKRAGLTRASARAHARPATTVGDGKASGRLASAVRAVPAVVGRDLAGAWAWRETPPALARLWAARIPDRAAMPGDGPARWLLWAAWVGFNHLWALPVTAIGYGLLWTQQHPARAFPTVVALIATTTMLITSL